jgi:hypothetical protein
MDSFSIRASVRWVRGLAMLMVLLTVGCGRPPMAEVSGVVTYNGEPLHVGSIVFMNDSAPNRYQIATGTIQGGGRYHLTEVACGDVRISVTTPPPIGPVRGTVIPKHYADLDKSGLTYTVTSGSQTFDIKLSGPTAQPGKTGAKSFDEKERERKQKRMEKKG